MSETPNPHDAARLAKSHKNAQPVKNVTPFLLDDLTGHQKALRAIYEELLATPPDERTMPYAAEWLLDNFYLVERAFRQIREDMPAAYYRRLPQLDTDDRPTPRIYAVARQIVRHHRGRLDTGQVADFLAAYQQMTPLTIG